jgi:hypothetical protein
MPEKTHKHKSHRMTEGMREAMEGTCPPGTHLRSGYHRRPSVVESSVFGTIHRAGADVSETCAKNPGSNSWVEFIRRKRAEILEKTGKSLNAAEIGHKYKQEYYQMKAQGEIPMSKKSRRAAGRKRKRMEKKEEEEEEESM